jgi:uncharacterized protein YbgA (DUF1722 family)
MVGVTSATDHTAPMRRFAAARLRALAALDLSGYVFKEGSPSCGVARVPVLGRDGHARPGGRGLFAAAFMAAFPLVPVEEEGGLRDAGRREHFVERIFAHRRWQTLVSGGVTRAALRAFHGAHELVLLAHSPRHHRALGRLLAEHETAPVAALARRYGAVFMEGLALQATVAKHAVVLRRLAGACRAHLAAGERRELSDAIDDYRHGRVPLRVPIALLRRYVERHRVASAEGQVYLAPYPKELMLAARTRALAALHDECMGK